MAKVQSKFSKFHDTIRVEKETLREKRDILVKKIVASLKVAGHPVPTPINQGSYIYGVGVIPLGDQEYDIDVGLAFDICSSDYDADVVKKWLLDAVDGHTKKVESRGPCIRVHYSAGYHVDLVVYATHKDDAEAENYQLGKNGKWCSADPKKLKEIIFDAREPFKDTRDGSGSDQMQRVVRCLKRWNDVAIPEESVDKPSGLATVFLVMQALPASVLDENGRSDDLGALIAVASWASQQLLRISIQKPTPEYEDLFAKIDRDAMKELVGRFKKLHTELVRAQNEPYEVRACEILAAEFGDDFPIPIKKSETQNQAREDLIADLTDAIPTFSSPSRPWSR